MSNKHKLGQVGTRGKKLNEKINQFISKNTWEKIPLQYRKAILDGIKQGQYSGSHFADGTPKPIKSEWLTNLHPAVLKYKGVRSLLSRGLGIDPGLIDKGAITKGLVSNIKPNHLGIKQTITPGPPKPLSIRGKSPFASNKVVDTTAYSPVTPKANITQTPPPNVMANRFMKIGKDKVGSTPGAQGSTLKFKPDKPMDVAAYDKGMQRQLLKIKPTSDHNWSLASTPPAQFRIGGKTIAFKKKEYMEKGKQQHHLVQKAVSGRVLQRIRALMNDPTNKLKASAKDLEEIHALPMKYGLEAGSGIGALLNMDTKPHLVLHGEHRRGITEDGGYQPGLEPSGRHLEELYQQIENANPKQLKNIYEEFLKEVSIPLKREAELYQDAYDKLKMGKMPTKQELTKLKKELGIQLEIIDEAKADKKERKLMNTIPEEMWYSKGR